MNEGVPWERRRLALGEGGRLFSGLTLKRL